MFAIILAGLILLALPADAATGATGIQGHTTVATDGTCQVNMTIHLHLDSSVSELYFPLPLEAENILLNGSRASARIADGAIRVALPAYAAGDHTFTLQYKLPPALQKSGEKLILTLPLLNRFPYPIAQMDFTISLPGEITARPEFTSGYHQADTDRLIYQSVSGNTLTCSALETLKDHETLTMTLQVDPAIFPDAMVETPLFSTWDGAALCLAVLAVLYYLITLLPRLPRRIRCYCAPDGISAGEVGTCLTGQGTDLTMMVISWAQAGYLRMELNRRGRVLLHKQMEMGNERSQFEIGCFQSLFSKRVTVDGTGYHYALLCRKLRYKAPGVHHLFLRNSGNPRIFRVLCCGSAACSGVSLAIFLVSAPVGRVFLGLLLAIACCGAGYLIQAGGKAIPLRDKSVLWLSLLCGTVWLLTGMLAGAASVAPMVLFQFLAGIAAAFGGRRSELGARSMQQLFGLKRYMVKADTFELQRLLQVNPNYFYELAPYALALGVDRQFAKRFGKVKLADCSFLTTPEAREMTPLQWAGALRSAADALNARQKRLFYERLLGRR